MTTVTATSSTCFVDSADGTAIAYDVTGTGPAVVVVEGARLETSRTTHLPSISLEIDSAVDTESEVTRPSSNESIPTHGHVCVPRLCCSWGSSIGAVGRSTPSRSGAPRWDGPCQGWRRLSAVRGPG